MGSYERGARVHPSASEFFFDFLVLRHGTAPREEISLASV
jgi:hypothetical protein